MPSYIYEVINNQYKQIDKIGIAGWTGLVYKIFERKKFITKLSTDHDGIGWEISKSDLRDQIKTDDWGEGIYEVVFDIEPSKQKTNLMQLENMYVFSHNYGERAVYWSVLMLILKPVLIDTEKQINKIEFTPTGNVSHTIKEFLYLRGDDGYWNWGFVGRMNGALLEPEAIDFFRKYF